METESGNKPQRQYVAIAEETGLVMRDELALTLMSLQLDCGRGESE
jgi:hypothetical protein